MQRNVVRPKLSFGMAFVTSTKRRNYARVHTGLRATPGLSERKLQVTGFNLWAFNKADVHIAPHSYVPAKCYVYSANPWPKVKLVSTK